jgi:AraC-like DNA-binding protein
MQRIRIDGAILALDAGTLTISEIAYASGFSEPAYFARVFKQHKGVSPQEFRAQLEAQRRQVDDKPKTVYHDHLDFTHGVPAAKQATPGGK